MPLDDDEIDDMKADDAWRRRQSRRGCECVGAHYPSGGCPGPENCPLAQRGEEGE